MMLADLLSQDKAEKRLIEVYRVEFYEWISNTLLAQDKSTIESRANLKAKEMISQTAREKATARHAGTYKTREEIVRHWREKISPTLSAQKAADEMLGLFIWSDGSEVAHKKLAEIVAEEKKKIRAAGSA